MKKSVTEVVLRLDDEEYLSVNKFCLASGFSLTEGIKYLIKEGLLLQSEAEELDDTKKSTANRLFGERVKYMEATLDRWITVFFRTVEGNERLGKKMAELESEIGALKKP
ncbi:MAG: hypothetical protein HC930_08730 [Hydrococcus sp. SU_1_0]|nr:hypothetical protein [Hydrococcus sp. SU_1_0]